MSSPEPPSIDTVTTEVMSSGAYVISNRSLERLAIWDPRDGWAVWCPRYDKLPAGRRVKRFEEANIVRWVAGLDVVPDSTVDRIRKMRILDERTSY